LCRRVLGFNISEVLKLLVGMWNGEILEYTGNIFGPQKNGLYSSFAIVFVTVCTKFQMLNLCFCRRYNGCKHTELWAAEWRPSQGNKISSWWNIYNDPGSSRCIHGWCKRGCAK